MKILIIGANGQVGQALQQTKHSVQALTRKELDLLNYNGDESLIKNICQGTPDVIINASAYTQVDKCENEKSIAMKINGSAVKTLKQTAEKLNCRFVHYSTDYVFDGKSKTAYAESHPPSPINAYGETKLAGEKALSENDLLIRTSWVHSPYGNNFIKTILRLAQEKQSLDIVGDQFGTPTSAQFIADKTFALLEKNLTGIYHATPNGQTSWFDYAQYIINFARNANYEMSLTNINKIASADYKTLAKRPSYSVLCNAKLALALRESLPDWQIGVKESLQKLLEIQ